MVGQARRPRRDMGGCRPCVDASATKHQNSPRADGRELVMFLSPEVCAPQCFAQRSIRQSRGHRQAREGRELAPCGTIRSAAQNAQASKQDKKIVDANHHPNSRATQQCSGHACIGESGKKILVSVFGGRPFSTSDFRRRRRQRRRSKCNCATKSFATIPDFESKEASKMSEDVKTAIREEPSHLPWLRGGWFLTHSRDTEN